MYPLIRGKIMPKGLIILSSVQAIKYLKPLSLCLNLSDITILSIYTKFKAIGFLEA